MKKYNISPKVILLSLLIGALSVTLLPKPAAALACVPAPAGAVSWWPADANANDIVGPNNGTLAGSTTIAPGLVDQAFSFNELDDHVLIPNSPSLTTGGPFTFEFWFSPSTTFAPGILRSPQFVAKGLDDSIGIANGLSQLEVRGPTPRPTGTTDTWQAGEWYHIGITYDATQYHVHVDGALEAQVASTTSIMNSMNDVLFGDHPNLSSDPNASGSFNGLLDEVTFYDRALSQAEIQSIATASDAGKCKTPQELQVTIDIKPGELPNSINLNSNGNVPVGILSTASFDATTVNPATVTLAGAGVKLKNNGTYMASAQDLNNDGRLDLLVHIKTQELQLTQASTSAELQGQTFSGQHIAGADSVQIVH